MQIPSKHDVLLFFSSVICMGNNLKCACECAVKKVGFSIFSASINTAINKGERAYQAFCYTSDLTSKGILEISKLFDLRHTTMY